MQGATGERRANARDAAAADLVEEIVATAAQIAGARGPGGEPLFAEDAESRLLTAIETSSRTSEGVWREMLLGDLVDHRMAAVTHVLRVIRRRLERDARERARIEREQRAQERLSRHRFFR